ncbi:unnamed protein product [Symbiodinium natans]|uniref:DNA (Cytosine-5)-methyltransferase n=1 Tax=Symbiodinium natans TaxID=878477 RepID=A0A812QH20_9DINO|nr:unnamed protein product [Symbiodinium natans]
MLELFSGTGSVGRAFHELLGSHQRGRGSQCQPRHTPRRLLLEPGVSGHFDFIWAFPVCTEYSRALTRRPRRLEVADRLVLRTLELIQQLEPKFWAIENPGTGLLKHRLFMAGLPWVDVTYCMYGYQYRKLTRIWNNLNWTPSRPVCAKGTDLLYASGAANEGEPGGRRHQPRVRLNGGCGENGAVQVHARGATADRQKSVRGSGPHCWSPKLCVEFNAGSGHGSL